MLHRFRVLAGSPAICTSVYVTSGVWRRIALRDAVRDELGRLEARPFRRAQVDFELRLVVVGVKFLSTAMNSGTLEKQHEDGDARDDRPVRHGPLEHARCTRRSTALNTRESFEEPPGRVS